MQMPGQQQTHTETDQISPVIIRSDLIPLPPPDRLSAPSWPALMCRWLPWTMWRLCAQEKANGWIIHYPVYVLINFVKHRTRSVCKN